MEKKILIIEDDLIDQMAIKRLFKREGLLYPYTVVSSIKAAKKELTEQQFNLVISDHNLADGTSIDLLDDIKNIPVILISGNEKTSTIESVINNSNTIANFTKDLDFKYLEELPGIIELALEQKVSRIHKKNNTITNNKKRILQHENVTIKLEHVFKIFDERTEDVKETIELFIYHKPREMNELYQSLNFGNCDNVIKVAHRMKSGFRVLGMKKQEDLANFIEKVVMESPEKCQCSKIVDSFKQLSTDTNIAIELLQKEIPLL